MNKRELIEALNEVLGLAEQTLGVLDPEKLTHGARRIYNIRTAHIATVRGFLNHISEMPKPKGEQPVAAGRRRVVLEEPHDEKYEAQPLDLPGSQRTNKSQRRQAMDEALGTHPLANVGATADEASNAIQAFGRALRGARQAGDTLFVDLETSALTDAERYLGDSGTSLADIILADALRAHRTVNDEVELVVEGDRDRASEHIECGQCDGEGETDAMGYAEECPVCNGSGIIDNPDYEGGDNG